ncbi:MAG: hypothetical protein ACFBQW_09110 [Sphingomonadaceae bacterium]
MGTILAPLLERPAFRSDLLYFIRLAGNYAAHIFIDMRERAASKQRKALAEWLSASPSPVADAKLREALIRKDRWFDALKQDFPRMLEEMPLPLRDRLSRALQHDHALPLDLRSFIRLLDDLRGYRHWLEHYEERRGRGQPVSDERLLRILGLMLLPFLGNHLIGRMRHHGRKAGMPGMNRRIEQAKAILDAALADRREASKFIAGLKKRTDHDSIRAQLAKRRGRTPSEQEVHKIAKSRAKERRDLENRKAALVERYARYWGEQSWPRYNYQNFLIRFAFIGRGRIAALEEMLAGAEQETPDFIHGIEPLFMLAMDVALIFHAWLAELEAEGVPVRVRKKAGPVAPALRNAIAHGGWFWEVENPERPGERLALAEILRALLALPERFGLAQPAEWRNDLLTRLEGALRPAKWPRVYRLTGPDDDPNRLPPPYVVKRWTAERRERFADRAVWRIERRAALRRIASGWMREIAGVRREEGN